MKKTIEFILPIIITIFLFLPFSKSIAQTQKGQDIDGEGWGDQSGRSVSLSSDGSIVAIGAPSNNGVNGVSSGHVRVYSFNSSIMLWEQKGQDIDGEAADDDLGFSVSLSSDGMILAIGANHNDGNGNLSGHVRVYGFNSGTMLWEQKGQDIDGKAAGDSSGQSVSLSADGAMLAIGANYNDGNGNLSGHVRVYGFNRGTMLWEQKGQDIDGEAANDLSGQSVSLSADGARLAIGANQNDGNGNLSGHVRVYSFNSGTTLWGQKGQDIDGEAAGDFSGQSVSLSSDGTIVAIGAPANDGIAGTASGQVRVYRFNNGTAMWEQKGQDIEGKVVFEQIGVTVSLSSDGSIVAIGAPFHNAANGMGSPVRIYNFNNGTSNWEQKGRDIESEGNSIFNFLGQGLSLSSDGLILAIGDPSNVGENGSRNGHVRVFSFCPITNLSTTTATCNDNTTTFEVSFTTTEGTGIIEVLDGATVVGSGTTSPIAATITGPTTAGNKVLVVRYQNSPCCMGTVDVNVPVCSIPPSIADPCSCTDPLNQKDGAGNITYFHDVLTITGSAGQSVVLTTGGTNFLDNNLAQIPDGTTLGTIPVGDSFTFDFFHGSGISGSIVVTVGGVTLAPFATSICNASDCSAAIPTMNQWGLLIFGLVLLNLSVFLIGRKEWN